MRLEGAAPAVLHRQIPAFAGLRQDLDLSVVICAYTRARWTGVQQAVDSALRQDGAGVEVVLVVDHNRALFERCCDRWPTPTPAAASGLAVRVVESTGARGLSGARNTGMALARAPVVAFLDDDAEAEADWALQLLAAYSDPLVLACGGLATPALCAPRPSWWPREFDWVLGCSYVGLPTERAEVRNVIGANMSVRRATGTALGGFAEGVGRVGALPFGGEETDLCIRLHQRWPSARIVHEPAARVHHTVPAERLSWRYFRARCFAEGLSKSTVGARVGTGAALASERAYVRRTLPRGVIDSLFGACRGRPGALRRAGAILSGLTITTGGYIWGRLTFRG